MTHLVSRLVEVGNLIHPSVPVVRFYSRPIPRLIEKGDNIAHQRTIRVVVFCPRLAFRLVVVGDRIQRPVRVVAFCSRLASRLVVVGDITQRPVLVLGF